MNHYKEIRKGFFWTLCIVFFPVGLVWLFVGLAMEDNWEGFKKNCLGIAPPPQNN